MFSYYILFLSVVRRHKSKRKIKLTPTKVRQRNLKKTADGEERKSEEIRRRTQEDILFEIFGKGTVTSLKQRKVVHKLIFSLQVNRNLPIWKAKIRKIDFLLEKHIAFEVSVRICCSCSKIQMETVIRKQLGLKTLESFGNIAGGCISKGGGYHSDLGDLFIKFSDRENAKRMFDGEFASLEALHQTETIKVPKPIKSISDNNRHCLVTEYIDLNGPSKPSQLGRELAQMHMHNTHLLKEKERASSFVGSLEKAAEPVTQFGFHVPTCCGYLPQNNEWCDDWIEFFVRNRLKHQIDMLLEKHNDRELLSSWPQLERRIPSFFKDVENIVPAIVHGDLWSGNYSYCAIGPVIFDPASFYAHSEYEFGIMKMFGGFGGAVYSAYHQIIPETKGIQKRIQLYELFHHLNHWNHFGSGYKNGTISLMHSLC
ncbi:Ketosamine-3-kinase [Dirofilaria immitis]